MNKKVFSILGPYSAGLVVVTCVYLSNPNRFSSEMSIWLSAIALGLATAGASNLLPWMFKSDGSVSFLGTLGLRSGLTALAELLGVVALTFAWKNGTAISRIFDVLSVSTLMSSWLAPKIIGTKIEELSNSVEKNSVHLAWKQQIEMISLESSDAQVKKVVEKLAESFEYLSSDLKGRGSQFDAAIETAINDLEVAVRAGSENETAEVISEVKKLVSKREIEVKGFRNKA